jgi:hypothetical protein
MESFFNEWDQLERMHPWGVNFLGPFLSGFGVPRALCNEVDDRLFIDLVTQVHPNVYRIKVEGVFSSAFFWLHIEIHLPFAVISFQRLPNMPFERSVCVQAVPGAVIACVLAFHRWSIGRPSRCVRRV